MNEGNWHWIQKDITKWCTQFLTSRLSPPFASLTAWDGDVTLCVRKGKLFCIYDLSFDLEISTDQKIKFKDVLSDTASPEELEMICEGNFSSSSSSSNEQRKQISLQVFQAFEEMKLEACKVFSQELLGTQNHHHHQSIDGASRPNITKQLEQQSSSIISPKSSASSKGGILRSFSTSKTFPCKNEDLWNCLWKQELVDSWSGVKGGGGNCVEAKVGGVYRIFDGAIEGKFEEFEFPKAKLSWREKCWPLGHFSTVSFELREQAEGSVLVIEQSGIPEEFAESNEKKWKNVFLHLIERQFRLYL